MLVEKRKQMRAEIPTASLADITFLLLLFFLVTTAINTDKGIPLVLPPPGQTLEVPKKNICNLLINDTGEVLLANEPILVPDIRNKIETLLKENDKLIVSVKTGKATLYSRFVDVLDQLKLADATRISIAEPEG